MTRLALNLSGYVNGVAPRHAETTRRMFPGYHISAIANGIHPATWAHRSFARLYDLNFPSWVHEPDVLAHADQLPDEEVREAHRAAKSDLLSAVRQRTGIALDPDVPLIVFARRMTGYKRPALLYSDLRRLRDIRERHPFQILWAGKAHPRDAEGRRLIETIQGLARELDTVPSVFLPNYDLDTAKLLVSGADVWLNTPQPPLEASGTSGMKAALNGVLNLSVLDGWWVDAWIEGVTGWAIGENVPDTAHAASLYDALEQKVLPLYFRDPPRWTWMMKQAISKIVPRFNSQRMMRRYAAEAYLR
jgi:starch phosphorylase